MTYAQTAGTPKRGVYTHKNPHPWIRPPSFHSLYHDISIDSKRAEAISMTDSILYDPENFNRFYAEILEEPGKITQIIGDVQIEASRIGRLISRGAVGLMGSDFRRYHEFANVLKFYVSKIDAIEKLSSKYRGHGSKKCCVPRRQTTTKIANSLSNLKHLLGELENDVTEFSQKRRKGNWPIHTKRKYVSCLSS